MVFKGTLSQGRLQVCRWSPAILGLLALALASSASVAQTPPAATASAENVAVSPAWNKLAPNQQTALAPLASTWSSLTDGQRRKWIALAAGFASLTASEKTTMHSRMAEWAALSPKDRALARLNFEQARKLTSDDRTAKWEAYQALPSEERQKFASEPARTPAGAAVTIKTVPANKLAEVPLTRHTQESKATLVKNPDLLDRKTLLPKASREPATVSPSASSPETVKP